MVALVMERVEQPITKSLKLMLIDPRNADTKRKLKSSCLNFHMIKKKLAEFDYGNADQIHDAWNSQAEFLREKIEELQKTKH